VTTIYNRLSDIFEVKYTLDWRALNDSNLEIVHIMWPEELITRNEDIDDFCLFLESVKLLVYTAHNKLPHDCSNQQINYRKLYLQVIEKSHLIIHMGVFSFKSQISSFGFKEKSIIIPHPILDIQEPLDVVDSCFGDYGRLNKRNIILVTGTTRKKREFVLSVLLHLISFKKDNYLFFSRVPKNWFLYSREFKGKYRLRNLVKFVFDKILNVGYSQSGLLDEGMLISQIIKSKVVLIPRISGYNSGIPFLVVRYGKPMIAFRTGNWAEFLKLSNVSYVIDFGNWFALRKKLNILMKKLNNTGPELDEILHRYNPDDIARQTAFHILKKYENVYE
jgi:hypothetical protein